MRLTQIVVVIVDVIVARGWTKALGDRSPLVIQGVVVGDRADTTSAYV